MEIWEALIYASLIIGTVATSYTYRKWRAEPREDGVPRLLSVIVVVLLVNVALIVTNIWAIDWPIAILALIVELYHLLVIIQVWRITRSTNYQHPQKTYFSPVSTADNSIPTGEPPAATIAARDTAAL